MASLLSWKIAFRVVVTGTAVHVAVSIILNNEIALTIQSPVRVEFSWLSTSPFTFGDAFELIGGVETKIGVGYPPIMSSFVMRYWIVMLKSVAFAKILHKFCAISLLHDNKILYSLIYTFAQTKHLSISPLFFSPLLSLGLEVIIIILVKWWTDCRRNRSRCWWRQHVRVDCILRRKSPRCMKIKKKHLPSSYPKVFLLFPKPSTTSASSTASMFTVKRLAMPSRSTRPWRNSCRAGWTKRLCFCRRKKMCWSVLKKN